MATSSDLCGFCFLEPVNGFCENCNKRLCSNCFSIHSRSSGHITFQVDNVAHIKCDPVSREVDIHEQKCPLHKTDYQSLYCGKHDIAICGRCIRADHMSCSDSIIDLHDITFDEHCLNGSLSALKECEQEINAIKTNVAEHDKSNDECKATYLHSIKECRKTLDARLDQLQSIVESAGESKYKQNNRRLRTVEEKCEETLNRIRERTDLIQDLSVKRQIRHLYVISRRLEKEILEFDAAIRQSNQEIHIEQFNFVKNSKLEHLLHEGINEFGTLREECDGSEEVVECGTDVQTLSPEKGATKSSSKALITERDPSIPPAKLQTQSPDKGATDSFPKIEGDIVFETFYHRSGKEFSCIYSSGMRFFQYDSQEWQPFPKRWYNEGLLVTNTTLKDDVQTEEHEEECKKESVRKVNISGMKPIPLQGTAKSKHTTKKSNIDFQTN